MITKPYLYTIPAYVDDIVDQLQDPELSHLRTLSFDELHSLHHSWGRNIRNCCGLWEPTHPLTKHWHEKPEERDMHGAPDFQADYSKDHPDYISMEIMRGVWKKVNA